MKKITAAFTLSFVIGLFLASTTAAFADTAGASGSGAYTPLTSVPGVFDQGQVTNPADLVKNIYTFSIGAASVLAVIVIIVAGIKYMYQESITGKSNAREQITNAFLGLLIVLGSYIFLATLNSQLVNINLNLTGAVVGSKVDSSSSSMESMLASAQNQVAAMTADIAAKEQALLDAQQAVTAATQSGDPAKIAAATKNLANAILNKTVSQIDLAQSKATAAIVQSIKSSVPGDTSGRVQAVQAANDFAATQQSTINNITDPATKAAAQNELALATGKTRVDVQVASIVNGLETGAYPTIGGAQQFNDARAKFLADSVQIAASLQQADPTLATQYRQYAVSQLAIIDAKWKANISNCPAGYTGTVENGCVRN